MATSLQVRFDEKWMPVPWTGCWLWTASIRPDGYGQIHVGGRPALAHRISFELHRGKVPDGLQLDHLCRERGCVNPEHLEPVTQRENILRGEAPPAINARKDTCSKGHAWAEHGTRYAGQRGRYCMACNRDNANRHYARKKKGKE